MRLLAKDEEIELFADIFDKEKFAKSRSVRNAIEFEEADAVLDLNEFAKNSVTVDDNPDRFKCILSKNSSTVKSVKRRYLQALPYYINERDKRLTEINVI